MNKRSGRKQPILRNGWFDQENDCIAQPINFLNEKNQWTQKGIQKVLEERRLWPAKGLNLSCPKSKCFKCQVTADYKTYVKGYKCKTCKIPW